MLLTQIPNPRYTQIRKSGIYLLANSHPNLSRPCLTSCTSSYRSLDCSESSAPLSPRNPSRPKRYKQTRALQTRSVGQQLPSATTGTKLIATIATSVRQTQLQAPRGCQRSTQQAVQDLPRPPGLPQMRLYVPLSMASLSELASVLRSKIVEWSVVSSSTSWMQFISWCFVSLPVTTLLPVLAWCYLLCIPLSDVLVSDWNTDS